LGYLADISNDLDFNWKIIGSSLSALVLFAALCVLSFYVGETNLSIALNLAVLVFGASLGCVVGIVVSPYSRKVSAQMRLRFDEISMAILTGILMACILLGIVILMGFALAGEEYVQALQSA
jgi:hypothetical protein